MNEYTLHTLGAAHNFTPTFDGRDPMRNRPYEHCAQIAEHHPFSPVIGRAIAEKIRQAEPQPECTVKRYGAKRDYAHGVGIPAMMESDKGEYVRYADYLACVAHNEMLLTLRKVADEKLAYALATIESMKARSVA